jgi:hypothetical protein
MPPPNPRTSPCARHHHADFFFAGLLSSWRFVASSSTLYYPSVSPKPIQKRPSPMQVMAPFSRCVHSYPILSERERVPIGKPLSQPLFAALRPQSTSTNHSISMGSKRSKAATRVVGGCRL